jgi:hypothetical protein
MRDRSEATATRFTAGKTRAGRSLAKPRPGRGLVQPAPGPEAPDVRDKVGAQRGMLIILVGAGLFWLTVAAALAHHFHLLP